MNIKEMFQLIDKNELVLPDFQRNFVWTKSGQGALAASVLLNLPIGSFLILEGNKNDFATKRLGFSTKSANPTEECKFLLDGQQRMTSLVSIFGNFFTEQNWKDTLRGMYGSLANKWFLRIAPKQGEEDIFGWNDLVFDESRLQTIEPSQIEEMIIPKTIGITKTNCWWNPDYSFVAEDIKYTKRDGKKFYLGVGREMAKERLLPLSLYDEADKRLLGYVLDIISSERERELKVELEDNLPKAKQLLDRAGIDTIYDDVTYENLEDVIKELKQTWKVNINKYLTQILDRTEAQIISLKSNEIGRAVIIFERINKGGTKLDNFDLVVARASRDNTMGSLTKRIIEHFEKDIFLSKALCCNLIGEKPKKLNLSNMETVKANEINSLIKNQYLNLLSILSYVKYGNVGEIKIELTKKEKILNISYQKINENTIYALKGLSRAIAFLQIRCGIIKISDLHYKLMLLPIAYLLIDDSIWESEEAINKIEYWYWGSIFAGEYRLYPNQISILDIQDLYNWIINKQQVKRYNELMEKIFKVENYSDESTLIFSKGEGEEIPIAIQKGILQYMISMQPRDLFYSDISINTWEVAEEKEIELNGEKIKCSIQDHHIIPLATATTLQESSKKIRSDRKHMLNSILNRTYILEKTNKIFSSNPPTKYLKKLEEDNNISMLNAHFIPDDYKEYLNLTSIEDEDKIIRFYKLRLEKLKTMVISELNKLRQ